MADIPTIQELKDQIENDIRTELSITNTWVGKVVLRVLATVWATKLKMFYLNVAELQKNLFADTANTEDNGGTLERFGRIKLNRNPFTATEGIYTLDVTGSTGGTITKGTVYKSKNTSQSPNKLFSVEADVTLSGATGQVQVRALEAGVDARLVETNELELTAPIPDVDNLAVVNTVDDAPTAAETLEEYRAKTLEAFRLEPQGGAATDYRLWALDVQGVRTAYAYVKDEEVFTVQSFIEALPADSEPGQPPGVPPAAMLAEVEAVYELDPDTTKPLAERGRRPMGVFTLEVLPVVPIEVIVKIYDLSDDSAAVVAAIEDAITTFLYEVRPYIAGADGENRNDTLYLSRLNAAIADALSSEVFYTNIIMNVGGADVISYQFGGVPGSFGNYPYLLDLELLTTP